MKYRFLADYRHRWPSRAHTEFKAGMVMTLKREVVDYALPRGLIEPVRNAAVAETIAGGTEIDALLNPPIPRRSKRVLRRVTDGK